MTERWSSLAEVVYKRTYSRPLGDRLENWPDTVARAIRGNVQGHAVSAEEISRLEYLMMNRKAMPAGRGLWFSGTEAQKKIGGAALNNCWFLKGDDWRNLVIAQDLLMLGGGVGYSIENQFVSALPSLKSVDSIEHRTENADFEVPDSREGWCELISRVLESYFETGKSFSYSTKKIRPPGTPILGFGGYASGPAPLIRSVEKIKGILNPRAPGRARPLEVMDVLCSIGEMVVSGNVRRSAILILGDSTDEDYLKAKRWDLHPIPSERAMANLSVVANQISHLGPVFWETYHHGEPFGIVNRNSVQKFGRMGELKPDDAIGVNPCAEATLSHGEPCNLQEIILPHLDDEKEFIEAARLMHRWGKRVTCEHYHIPVSAEVIKKNRRVGTSITGCLESPLFKPEILDRVYAEIQNENVSYSKSLQINESIRTTLIKPSGTLSLMSDCAPGIHPAYAPYFIRRVRFSSQSSMLPILKAAGHPMEPAIRADQTLDPDTTVVSFFVKSAELTPVMGPGFGLKEQLNTVLLAQKHWSDQAVSVTVYYKRDEIPEIQKWLASHLDQIKTISFLAHSDHGFVQAPIEPITEKEYQREVALLTPIDLSELRPIGLSPQEMDPADCDEGGCPVK